MENVMLGERIRKAREYAGFSQLALAQKVGVTASTVDNWETEKIAPRTNKLMTVSGVLNVPLIWLLAGGDELPTLSMDIAKEDSHAVISNKLQLATEKLKELEQLMSEIAVVSRNTQP